MQKKQLYEDMEEIKMRFGGDLEDVTERLEVDLRTSAGETLSCHENLLKLART